MKKIIIIITSIIIVTVLVNIILLNKKKEPVPVSTITPTKVSFVVPTGETIKISQVEVKNFYQSLVNKNNQEDALIIDNENYQITYLAQFNKFLITILNPSFTEIKIEAENIFLDALEITKDQACNLNVEISTPNFVNQEYAGEVFSLSFCQ